MNKQIKQLVTFIQKWSKDPLFLKWWDLGRSIRNLHSDQLSVHIHARTSRKPYPYHHDAWMFVEDMYKGLMPYMIYRGERENYPVVTTPEIDRQTELMLADGINSRDRSFDLGDALCDFVRSASQSLFQEGVAYYEINKTCDEEGRITEFDLDSITPYGLWRFGSYYYQFVSWREAKEQGTRVRLVKIPKEKIIEIRLPKEIASRSTLKRILKRLYLASVESIPSFHMKAMEQNKSVGFDVKKYSKSKYLEKAIITKSFGWDQRQALRQENYITEYYSMVIFLRKKKAEARIRTHILNTLNDALNSKYLDLGIRFEMQNLFSVEDVEEQEALLKKGSIKFMDIFNALKI